ncbi:arsenate reductase family protein [Nitrosomonas communis]|uniref:arsenate reductase family protein n=1 Tax=Nitrosomonas communis TaxID=44574 RepID=UPI0026EAF733|nr:arsenate reductase family protein [Nitrosomonas communis]MCO6426578.1 arsenate reductase family protein [Nitrosomonas communis]
MNDKITIYQKPTCSKCRAALTLLNESGKEFDSINYYERPMTVELLRELLHKLNMSVRDILRTDEAMACGIESGTDEELLQMMVANPDLIQRPIVVRGDKAILGRPPENVKKLLE